MITKLDQSRLESLLESAKLLSATLQLDDLLRHLLRTVMGRLLVRKAAVAIDNGGRMCVEIARGVPGLAVGMELTDVAARASGLELFFDIGEGESKVGLLGISRPARGELEIEEQDFLRALLGLAASGIANARAHNEAVRLNRSLDQKVQELRALLDLVRGLAATIDPEEVAQLLMLTLAGRWMIRKHAVATWKDGHPPIIRHKGLELTNILNCADDIAQLPYATVTAVEDANNSLWTKLGVPPGSLVIPIRSGESTSGIVICGPRPANLSYNEADLEFGAGLVGQAAVAFDNAWHFRETIGKKQMEKELMLAASIQQDLFPKHLPHLQASDLAAHNRQARQVGGDYYDAIPVGDAAMHMLCVVDISGKGVFASLLMSNIQATLRALLSRESNLPSIAISTNDLLWATTPSNRYATAFLLMYDPPTGDCRWVNCGHNDGVVLRADGTVEMLTCSGLALGLFANRVYEDESFTMQDGDLLAIYSDGVTDAQDLQENEFGTDRLVESLRLHAGKSATQIVDQVFRTLDEFVGTAPQFDDITLMILKRTGAATA